MLLFHVSLDFLFSDIFWLSSAFVVFIFCHDTFVQPRYRLSLHVWSRLQPYKPKMSSRADGLYTQENK